MRCSIRSRSLVLAVAAGASLTLPLAVPSGAALKQSVACSKVSAKPVAVTGKISSSLSTCTPAKLAAGGDSLVKKPKAGKFAGQLVNIITWKNKQGTTTTKLVYKTLPPAQRGKCPKPYQRVNLTGSVLDGTGPAKAIVKKGEPITGSTCSITSGALAGKTTVYPGIKFKI